MSAAERIDDVTRDPVPRAAKLSAASDYLKADPANRTS